MTTRAKPKPVAIDPGERAVRFLNNLKHTGDYAGQPFKLRPWQEGPIRKLFGTLRPDGTRQYRKTFWFYPRKQGKTETVAGSALYLAVGQLEYAGGTWRTKRNRRIYTAAGGSDQASLIFNAAAEMIRQDETLSELAVIYPGYKRIDFPAGNSFIKVLSSAAYLKHGLGPTDVLIDELHVCSRELVNVLTTGFGAVRDPLTWMISTAGHDRHSICYEEWEYACKVRDGEIEDPSYLPVIYGADEKDDWTSEATWHKAMPALGDFCSLEFIREEFKKAKERPRFENTFKTLYLNLWVEAASRWISSLAWDALDTIDPASLDGKPCWAGFDAGVSGDTCSYAMAFENDLGGFDLDVRYWVPGEGRWRDEPRSKELYPLWERQGFLTFTDGAAIDTDTVERDIAELNDNRPVRLLLGDRAYAMGTLTRLFNTHDIPVKGIPQGPVTLNEPMKTFEDAVAGRKIRHTGNPVLTYNVANAKVRKNSTGLMFLDKANSSGVIDGLAAAIDAIRASMPQACEQKDSVYNTRELIIL